MSLSFIARTRAQSVLEVLEEDRLLMLIRLAKGDDMDPPWRFGVDDRYDNATQKPERYESLFGIFEAIVSVSKGRASEYLVGVDEV
jgi:hypothetical protein